MEYPYSCVKSTENACRYIYALDKVPMNHPIIQKLIPYLIENYNEKTGEWKNLTVPEVNDYPHAPWWEYEESEVYIPSNREDLIEHYNPTVNSALAGILVKYSPLVPKKMLDEVMGIIIDKIDSDYKFEQYGMMSVNFFVSALTDENTKGRLLKRLMGDGKLITILDEYWGTENSYKLCQWIDSPKHPYYELYKTDVHKNLDFLINSQEVDGSWLPSWSWGEADVWARIVKRLKGVLTVKFLWTLQKFGRIEN